MIIFDFDGPIVDSYEGAFAVTQMVYPDITHENFIERFRHNIHMTPEHLTLHRKNEHVDFDEEYLKYITGLTLCPSKRLALFELSTAYDFHIVSGSHSNTLNAFLTQHRIDHLFTDVLGHDFAKGKSERFLRLLDKHQVAPKDAVFVTDTTGDIEEARNVSLGTIIAVLDGFHSHEWLREAQPHHCISSIIELPELLQVKK